MCSNPQETTTKQLGSDNRTKHRAAGIYYSMRLDIIQPKRNKFDAAAAAAAVGTQSTRQITEPTASASSGAHHIKRTKWSRYSQKVAEREQQQQHRGSRGGRRPGTLQLRNAVRGKRNSRADHHPARCRGHGGSLPCHALLLIPSPIQRPYTLLRSYETKKKRRTRAPTQGGKACANEICAPIPFT